MSRRSNDSSNEENTSSQSPPLSKFLDDPTWPAVTLSALEAELKDTSEPNTQDLLSCELDLLNSLQDRFLDPNTLQSRLPLGRPWRRLYTDAVLVKALTLLSDRVVSDTRHTPVGVEGKDQYSATWKEAIGLLDRAIILSGAPGEGRLELIYSCICYIQHKYLNSSSPCSPAPTPQYNQPPPVIEPPLMCQPVSRIEPSPSFSAFPSRAQRAFLMPSFAGDWPAIERWKSKDYLLKCSGSGRVVPIERGGDYRNEDWGVDIMDWDSFLDGIGWGHHADKSAADPEQLYLAQHSLFTQFPILRTDILIPDYIYTTPKPCPAYPGPPGNEDQLVINAWCGGQGANSPAHTDPYYNIYVQVVGYKHVWLSPPDATPGMYAYDGTSKPSSKTEQDPKRKGMIGNTSSIDVFALSASESCSDEYPLFYTHALPLASSTLLKPGDALVIPAGWWHAMRGIGGGSFSVSFWF